MRIEKDDMTLPIEPIRDWYVTYFGGRSEELNYNQVGINKRALLKNTNLTPYQDKVTIKRMEGERIIPFYTRKWFEIVPLDRDRPNALAKSPRGEAVLPIETTIIKRPSYMDILKTKEPLILNNVLSKVFKDPEDWSKVLSTNHLLKKRISF